MQGSGLDKNPLHLASGYSGPKAKQPARRRRVLSQRPEAQLRLCLYSKPGCHLCEGLEVGLAVTV